MTNYPPFLLICATFLAFAFAQVEDVVDTDADGEGYPQNCHAWAGATCEWEPNLRPMTVHYESNALPNETFYAYVTPDVSTFYNDTAMSRKEVLPRFKGQFGKFINMSPKPVTVHWKSNRGDLSYISDVEPFGTAATATYPGHRFVVTPQKMSKVLTEWTVEEGNALYYYDPFHSNHQRAHKVLSEEEYHLYHIQLQNRIFAQQYREFTGTDWLALYKYKDPPRFHQWRADAIGQTHTITTEAIPFVTLPPSEELARGASPYGPRPDDLQRMRPFQATEPTLDLHLTVLSCAPRVFQIRNFLSPAEVEHLLQLAEKSNMRLSSTKAGDSGQARTDKATRTSKNAWLPRNTDMVLEIIHRRAADVLQMPESLLRWRRTSEIPEFPESMVSVAERLQLVHYNVGERTYPDWFVGLLQHYLTSIYATNRVHTTP